MAANFNFNLIDNPLGTGKLLLYGDASGNTAEILDGGAILSLIGSEISSLIDVTTTATLCNIAESYSKKTYPANSLVINGTKLYYNPIAINTAENWTAAHWTRTTVADYIKLMTT